MQDTLITIIAIFAGAVLMFVFPLMATTSAQEGISQTAVQTLVSDFANTVATKGKITPGDYNAFVQKLQATGNTYEVEIEHQILDENPGKKSVATSADALGENIYYSVFTTDIMDDINQNKDYLLKKGDYIIVTVKNTNVTMATQVKNFFYKIVGNDTYTIAANASVLVINTGA